MNRRFSIMLLLGLGLTSCSCDDQSEVANAPAEVAALPRVLQEIRYIKDPRTGICFAYRWGLPIFDGPSLALATVPCEAVASQK